MNFEDWDKKKLDCSENEMKNGNMFMGWVKISHEDILMDLSEAYVDCHKDSSKLLNEKFLENGGIKKVCIWVNEISDTWGFTLFIGNEKENYMKLNGSWFKCASDKTEVSIFGIGIFTFVQNKVTNMIEDLYKSCKGIFKIVKNNWELD